MPVEAPSAPSTPAAPASAPSDSAPAGGGDQPSWAAPGGVNDFLSGVTSDRAPANPAPQTRMETKPAGSPSPAPAEAAASAPAPVPAAPVEAQPTAPANPVSAAPATTAPTEIMLAGRFKAELAGVDKDPGVQALAKAYDASGVEARRLLQVANEEKGKAQALEKAIQERDSQLEALKLEKQLGPEIVDPTPDELATWSAQKVAAHEVSKLKREQLKEKLETQKKQSDESTKVNLETRKAQVLERIDHMSAQKEEFPGFEDYMKMDEKGTGPIADWMPLLPMLSGHPIAPLVLYLVAKGHDALQKDKASAVASKQAKLKAEELARASIPAAAGAGGGPGPQPTPAKPAESVDPDSDEGHNARLIASHSWTKPLLPID